MFRYWLFVAAVIGTAATAVASIAPGTATDFSNVTVVEKNQNWQPADSVTVYNCPQGACAAVPEG